MSPEDRKERAFEKAAAYRSRLADGTSEPLEDFLAANQDLRDLLEPMLTASQADTANIPPLEDKGIVTMLPDSLQRDILAINAEPEEKRKHRIEELCQRHPSDADEIRALLDVLEGTEKQIHAATQETSWVPEQIGPYRILQVLGEGGMGTVYLAEQQEPIQRSVALKVIKPGMDSTMVLRRFEAERQALARMEHSSIARVYQAGTTERGQPYFAMEYVKGQPIAEYCDEQHLSLEDRLDLFCQVCSGVQHAHQKGVIHRDLTPRNILVTVGEDRPVPKIIDFGIARATDHRLIEATLYTEEGQIIGTPEYMSPEQAGLGDLDIDTRSDVYSLGVLLYELLTGTLPFSGEELRAAGLTEMERKIREEDPPRPSTRLTSLGADREHVARLRRMDLKSLKRKLRVDLDWIVMKALEKDRTRRYETAVELAEDIQRHLADEPVLAGPPSLRYRTGKFIRRYRGQVIAAGVVLAILLAGMAATTSFMLEAQAERRSADVLASGAALSLAQQQLEDLDRQPAWPVQIPAFEAWIASAPQRSDLAALREELSELEASGIQDLATQSRRETLEALEPRLVEFLEETGELERVRWRLEWARQVQALTDTHPNATVSWAQAREAIGNSALYRDPPVDLQQLQMGLVPIGVNPKTGLWEFYHLLSAADPEVIPQRNDEGHFDVTPEMGIIFVLIPGGEFDMGAQKDDPNGDNHDPNAGPDEGPVGRVRVDEPFLLAKYEMTQGQWERLSFGDRPSAHQEGHTHEYTNEAGETREVTVTLAHPVEQVDWNDCAALLYQHGLKLPTEAQWEYACRAGTGTPWSSGDSIAGLANVSPPPRNGTMPVGSFSPNDFGLFDMHGNVVEFCDDVYRPEVYSYQPMRGGGWELPFLVSRSAWRGYAHPTIWVYWLGLRPARLLQGP